VFNNLVELSKRGNTITEQNVDYALSLSFTESDHAILEIDKDIICRTINGKPVKPKTLGQKQYVDAIRKKMIVFFIHIFWCGACGYWKNLSGNGNGDSSL
jgi:phosphate starvation-inducible PhoH-like protein